MKDKAGRMVQTIETKKKESPFQNQKDSFTQTRFYRVDPSLNMQRSLGNLAMQRMLEFKIIQAKLKIGAPDDKYEQEADRVADQVMRMPEETTVQRKPQCTECNETEEENIQAKSLSDYAGLAKGLNPGLLSRIHSLKGEGQTLPESTRSFFESRFGRELDRVRVHDNSQAAEIAAEMNAKAFTTGKDVVFGAGYYSPATREGKRLLAHELTHTLQQGAVGVPSIQRQEQTQDAPQVEEETAVEEEPEWSRRLGEMLGCRVDPESRRGRRRRRRAERRARRRGEEIEDPYDLCVGLLERIAQTITLHTTFSEAQLEYIVNGAYGNRQQERFISRNKVMGVIALYYAAGDLEIARHLMRQGRDEDDLRPLTVRSEVGEEHWGQSVAFVYVIRSLRAYAQTFSARDDTDLIGSRPYDRDPDDPDAAIDYEAVLNGYLDELSRLIPLLDLTQDQKNRYFNELLIVLRRAFMTGTRGTEGMENIEAITTPEVVEKYRQLVALLVGQMTGRQNMSIITETISSYTLPDPVPEIDDSDFQIDGNQVTVNLGAVPEEEHASVRYGVREAIRTIFAPPTTIEYRNAYWAVTMPVRAGGNIERIRYELVFDNESNIRVERLGEAELREVDSGFASLSVNDKKDALIHDFGLAGVDDRDALPAKAAQPGHVPPLPAIPAQPAARWQSSELDQVKAAYELLPQTDRAALRGITLVREHVDPTGGGLQGFFHTKPEAIYDEPQPPAHDAPHIHYYDSAFDSNELGSVGAPGATGPISDWTLLHEVGHAVIYLPLREADAEIESARTIPTVPGFRPRSQAERNAYNTWEPLTLSALQAVRDFKDAVMEDPPRPDNELDDLEQAALDSRAPRDNARNDPNFPAVILQAAVARDTTVDNLLTAVQHYREANRRNTIFVSIANRLGFHRFTDYARSGGDKEWFAETYALYITDPNRLNEMNRDTFLWFEAGMPFDPDWEPPG
jgi:hypothetical protein